jgi:hypothetical protein
MKKENNNPEEVKDGNASGKELKIWHWNVNGIRAVLNSQKFQDFIKQGKYFSYGQIV